MTKEETSVIKKIQKVVEEFRKLDGEMPMQMASTFMVVARHQGITMKDIAEKVGVTQSSVSRNIGALGSRHRYGKEGLKLVKTEEDDIDIRRKVVHLTPKGTKFVASLVEILQEN